VDSSSADQIALSLAAVSSPNQIAIALAATVIVVGYLVFILAPAWASYGRFWERSAAGFLSLYILASLLAFGAGVGFAIVWFYDHYA